jgi:peptidoglycan/xylan/chitin deacetylase (PgdA/CDA1 family)
MLNFRTTNFVFTALSVLLILLIIQLNVSWWFFALLASVYLILLVIGSSRISSNFFLPVICRSGDNSKSIAITFDDGPAADFTPQILDILRKNNTPATFFCIGKNALEQADIIRRIDQEGHLLGNHSLSHDFFFDFYSGKKISAELRKTNAIVRSIAGKEMKYFRPPYGVTTPNIAAAVRETKFHTIGWSVRTLDTVIKDREKLLKKVTKNLKAGDIILFHDTVDVTVHVLQDFIDRVLKQGFQIVRLDRLINIPAYA